MAPGKAGLAGLAAMRAAAGTEQGWFCFVGNHGSPDAVRVKSSGALVHRLFSKK